jgi:hypothetical protein
MNGREPVDASKWSGEGEFTQVLVDRLQQIDEVTLIRIEDAPASRAEANYNLISNEIFVRFATRHDRVRRFPYLPAFRQVTTKAMTLAGLEQALAETPHIGAPDYADEGMLQYLKTERIVAPYQTRGYKMVELVRVYEIGTTRVS